MTREFITYEQALALKELGFDEPCFRHYKNNGTFTVIGRSATRMRGTQIIPKSMTGAPLYQQAFRWFREKYGLKHDIDDDNVGTKFYYKIKSYTDKFDNYDDIIKPMREEKDWAKIEFKTYEEAELACLKKLIEICKEKKS